MRAAFAIVLCLGVCRIGFAEDAPPPRAVPAAAEKKPEPAADARLGSRIKDKLAMKLAERLSTSKVGERLGKVKEKLGGQLNIETVKSFMKDFDPEVINEFLARFKKIGGGN